jgi:hypothetical protein
MHRVEIPPPLEPTSLTPAGSSGSVWAFEAIKASPLDLLGPGPIAYSTHLRCHLHLHRHQSTTTLQPRPHCANDSGAGEAPARPNHLGASCAKHQSLLKRTRRRGRKCGVPLDARSAHVPASHQGALSLVSLASACPCAAGGAPKIGIAPAAQPEPPRTTAPPVGGSRHV